MVPWREALLYEYFKEYGPGVPKILGVRTKRRKYVTYPELPDDISELYDLERDPLERDPLEIDNLIDVPGYVGVVAKMRGALEHQLAETGHPVEVAV